MPSEVIRDEIKQHHGMKVETLASRGKVFLNFNSYLYSRFGILI